MLKTKIQNKTLKKPTIKTVPFFNRNFDKKRLKLLFSWYYANKGEIAAFSLVENLQKLGFTYAMRAGISLGVDDLNVPPDKNQSLIEAIDSLNTTKASVQSGNVTALEEFQQFVDTWHRTSENLKTSVVINFTKNFKSIKNLSSQSSLPTFPVTREAPNGLQNTAILPSAALVLVPKKDKKENQGIKLKSFYLDPKAIKVPLVSQSSRKIYKPEIKCFSYSPQQTQKVIPNKINSSGFSGAKSLKPIGSSGAQVESENIAKQCRQEVPIPQKPILQNSKNSKLYSSPSITGGLPFSEKSNLTAISRSYGNNLNPVYMMAFSGARGNLSQVRQLVGMRGLMADPQGQLVEFPIQSNFREGLTVTEYMISCYGARKGIVDTALRTAAAGYLTRRLVDVSHHQIVRFVTCGTKNGILLPLQTKGKKQDHDEKNLPSAWKVPIKSLTHNAFDSFSGTKTLAGFSMRREDMLLRSKDDNSLKKKKLLSRKPLSFCIGRVLAQDIPGIAFRNQEVDISLGSSEVLREVYDTIGVSVRSPLTCKAETGICQLCYGWSVSANRLVGLGEAVGIIAAQSIGEPGTQLTMRTFHTGGVFSGDIMEECRAKHEGYVNFHGIYLGLMVRTAGGAVAFCMKTSGVLTVHGLPKDTTYTFLPNTLLFVRQGERVFTDTLLAQIPNLPEIEEASGESTKTLVSNFSGEVRQTNVINRELENIRILSGQKNVPLYLPNNKHKLSLHTSLQNSTSFLEEPRIKSPVPGIKLVKNFSGSHRFGSSSPNHVYQKMTSTFDIRSGPSNKNSDSPFRHTFKNSWFWWRENKALQRVSLPSSVGNTVLLHIKEQPSAEQREVLMLGQPTSSIASGINPLLPKGAKSTSPQTLNQQNKELNENVNLQSKIGFYKSNKRNILVKLRCTQYYRNQNNQFSQMGVSFPSTDVLSKTTFTIGSFRVRSQAMLREAYPLTAPSLPIAPCTREADCAEQAREGSKAKTSGRRPLNNETNWTGPSKSNSIPVSLYNCVFMPTKLRNQKHKTPVFMDSSLSFIIENLPKIRNSKKNKLKYSTCTFDKEKATQKQNAFLFYPAKKPVQQFKATKSFSVPKIPLKPKAYSKDFSPIDIDRTERRSLGPHILGPSTAPVLPRAPGYAQHHGGVLASDRVQQGTVMLGAPRAKLEQHSHVKHRTEALKSTRDEKVRVSGIQQNSYKEHISLASALRVWSYGPKDLGPRGLPQHPQVQDLSFLFSDLHYSYKSSLINKNQILSLNLSAGLFYFLLNQRSKTNIFTFDNLLKKKTHFFDVQKYKGLTALLNFLRLVELRRHAHWFWKLSVLLFVQSNKKNFDKEQLTNLSENLISCIYNVSENNIQTVSHAQQPPCYEAQSCAEGAPQAKHGSKVRPSALSAQACVPEVSHASPVLRNTDNREQGSSAVRNQLQEVPKTRSRFLSLTKEVGAVPFQLSNPKGQNLSVKFTILKNLHWQRFGINFCGKRDATHGEESAMRLWRTRPVAPKAHEQRKSVIKNKNYLIDLSNNVLPFRPVLRSRELCKVNPLGKSMDSIGSQSKNEKQEFLFKRVHDRQITEFSSLTRSMFLRFSNQKISKKNRGATLVMRRAPGVPFAQDSVFDKKEDLLPKSLVPVAKNKAGIRVYSSSIFLKSGEIFPIQGSTNLNDFYKSYIFKSNNKSYALVEGPLGLTETLSAEQRPQSLETLSSSVPLAHAQTPQSLLVSNLMLPSMYNKENNLVTESRSSLARKIDAFGLSSSSNIRVTNKARSTFDFRKRRLFETQNNFIANTNNSLVLTHTDRISFKIAAKTNPIPLRNSTSWPNTHKPLSRFVSGEGLASYTRQKVTEKFLGKSLASHTVKEQVGCFINIGDEIIQNFSSPASGQIIEKSRYHLTLRRTQNILYSNIHSRPAQVSKNVKDGNWLNKGTSLVTLPYLTNVTGDIVAGIPKIEQLFEARGEALYETIEKIWFFYKTSVVPPAKAVRECLKEIGLFIVSAIQKVYSSQGVHIADKHLEVIVRQMTRRAIIVNPGDTPFLPDEFIDLQIIERVNWSTYGENASYRPCLVGITKASLTSNSFLSSASFQQTARVLERETFLEKTDRLLGLKERVMMGATIYAGTGNLSTNVRLPREQKVGNSLIKQSVKNINFFSRRKIQLKQGYSH